MKRHLNTFALDFRSFPRLLRQAFHQWIADQAPRMGAALAFYTAFSLAPLLILIIATGGVFFNSGIAEKQILDQIGSMIGRDGAKALQTMIVASRQTTHGMLASLLGVVTLFIGATGALIELQDGLNRVWQVRESDGLIPMIRQRLLAFPIVIGVAFLLLVSLVVSATLSALGAVLQNPASANPFFWQSIDLVLSWGVITWLFAMIYKILPNAPVRWIDVSVGGAVASFLFTAGKFLVGLYIAKSTFSSSYGAAGSFVVILLWVYYSALILYFGAEFSKTYRDRLRPDGRS